MELDILKVKVLKMESLDGEIHLTQCPPEFRKVAEKIVVMLDKQPFKDTYVTMTELDKKLTLRYWKEYDYLVNALIDTPKDSKGKVDEFEGWFLSQATNPDVISRARRYLVSDARLLIIPKNIAKHAKQAEDSWAKHAYQFGGG